MIERGVGGDSRKCGDFHFIHRDRFRDSMIDKPEWASTSRKQASTEPSL